LVGGFTIRVRTSCHWAVRSTLDHWLSRKCEGETNVDKDEEDESEELFAKLVVILLVGELVGVFHESIGDGREEGCGSCGSPQIVQGRVTLIMKNWSTQADCYQQELEGCVHLADSGRLDGGSGEGGVKVFCPSEWWDHRHVPDVKPSIDEEKVSGHNEASERGRYLTGIGESQENHPNQDFVRQRIQKTAQAGRLAWKPSCYGPICEVSCSSVDKKSSSCGIICTGNAVGNIGRCNNSGDTEKVWDCHYSVFLLHWG